MLISAAKKMVKSASSTRLWDTVASHMERRTASPGALRVLTYHRVDLPENRPLDYPGLISASPAEFRRQVQFLAENYRVVTLDQVFAAADQADSLPEKAVLLTFDDATVDFAEHAWPVLKSLGLSATVFVPTAYPDDSKRHFWWNRLYRAVFHSPDGVRLPFQESTVTLTSPSERRQIFRNWKERFKTMQDDEFQARLERIVTAGAVPDPESNGVLGWKALQDLHRDGVTLAPHTHTHPMLNRLPEDSIRNELTASCETLRLRLGCQAPLAIAYPAGGYNESVARVMRDLQFRLGFTTRRGVNFRLNKPFQLHRINVGGATTLGLLRIQLANWGLC